MPADRLINRPKSSRPPISWNIGMSAMGSPATSTRNRNERESSRELISISPPAWNPRVAQSRPFRAQENSVSMMPPTTRSAMLLPVGHREMKQTGCPLSRACRVTASAIGSSSGAELGE